MKKKNALFLKSKLKLLVYTVLSFATIGNATAQCGTVSTTGSYSGSPFTCLGLTVSGSGTTYTISANGTYSSSSGIHVQSGATLIIDNAAIEVAGGNIVIDPGCHLIIQNSSVISMGEDRMIEVQSDYTNTGTPTQGGTLLVNNSTITKASGVTWWRNISVWGMNGYGQSNASQQYSAKAEFNNATIEWSQWGITNYSLTSPFSASGGVIKAVSTVFSNNADAAVDMKNQRKILNGLLLNDFSHFILCTFQKNDPSTSPGFFVNLFNVDGERFLGCSFDGGDRVTGAINANGSGVTVMNYCSGGSPYAGFYGNACGGVLTKSSFTNFTATPVVVKNYLQYHTVAVEDCSFTNGARGISLTGCSAPIVVGNNFTIANNKIGALGYIGIVLNNCPNLKVEANTISSSSYSGWSPSPSNHPLIGIIAETCGELANSVYGNTISNMDYALEALDKNRSDPAHFESGLQLVCNTMDGNSIGAAFDVLVTNKFYPYGSPYQLVPQSGITKLQYNLVNGSATAAGNKFASKGGGATVENYYNELPNAFYPINYYYDNSPANEYPTYNNINSFIITHSECYNHYLHNINISSTQLVSNRPTVAGAGGLYNPDQRSVQINTYASCTDSALFGFMFSDTLGPQIDSIALILENTDYLYDYQIMLAGVYISQGRHQDAIDLIDDLPNHYAMETYEVEWMQHIKTAFRVEKELYDNGYDWFSVDSVLRDSLYAIADSDGYFARHMARGYLQQYEDSVYEDEYGWVDLSSPKHGATAIFNNAGNSDRVYPNPATDMVFVETDKSSKVSEIVLTDITGKVLIRQNVHNGKNAIDVSGLVNGIYFVKLYESGTISGVTKLIKE
jgi:hypothetical protein